MSSVSTQLNRLLETIREDLAKVKVREAAGKGTRNIVERIEGNIKAAKMIAKDQGITVDWSSYTVPEAVKKVQEALLGFGDLKLMPYKEAEMYLFKVLESGRISQDTFRALQDSLLEHWDSMRNAGKAITDAADRVR